MYFQKLNQMHYRKRIKDNNFGFAIICCQAGQYLYRSEGRHPPLQIMDPPDNYKTTYDSKTKIVVFCSLIVYSDKKNSYIIDFHFVYWLFYCHKYGCFLFTFLTKNIVSYIYIYYIGRFVKEIQSKLSQDASPQCTGCSKNRTIV